MDCFLSCILKVAVTKGKSMKKTLVIIMCLLLSACAPSKKEEENQSSNRAKIDINGQISEFDIISGATTGKVEGPAFKGDEKAERMKWSGRPKIGLIEGDYTFDSLNFNGGYLATVAIIQDSKTKDIISVRFDEKAPENYYAPEWQNQTKRTSGYANWQMENERTDVSLVTIVNAMTYLESQVLENNSVTGNFKNPKGASTSAVEGFIPLLAQVEPKLKSTSPLKIISVTRELGGGIFGSLQVVYNKETNKIVDFHYDEFFADEKGEITEETLQKYYRQSKYQSPSYLTDTNSSFKDDVNKYRSSIVDEEKLRESDTLGDGFNKIVNEINNYSK